MQALHYLTLSILVPPLLNFFAEPIALTFEGGAANVGMLPVLVILRVHILFSGMVMDWREMAGRPTVHGLGGDDRRGWSVFRGAYSGGRKVGDGSGLDWWPEDPAVEWDGRTDPFRGWVIAFCWIAASCVEYVLCCTWFSELCADYPLLFGYRLVYIIYTLWLAGHDKSSISFSLSSSTTFFLQHIIPRHYRLPCSSGSSWPQVRQSPLLRPNSFVFGGKCAKGSPSRSLNWTRLKWAIVLRE